MNRESIIDKIKKLFELASNNPNANEAIAAALKAQKLMADYDISEHELVDKTVETIEEAMSYPYAGHRWREILAAIIAENFRCKNYILYCSKNPWTQGKKFQQVFVGYKNDAQAALLVFNKLVEIAEELARIQCREVRELYGTAQGVKNTFLLGFCYGVKLELEKQSQALMIVVPKAVEEHFITQYEFDKGNNIGQFEIADPYFDYTEEGKQAGRDAVRSRRIEGNTSEISEDRLLA